MEVTVIKEENRSYFAPLMEEALWEETDLALGAMENGKVCGLLAGKEEETVFQILQLTAVEQKPLVLRALLEALEQVAEKIRWDVCIFQNLEETPDAETEKLLEDLDYEKDVQTSPVYEVKFSDLSDRLFAKKGKTENAQPLSLVSTKKWNEFAGLAKAQMEELDLHELEEKDAYDQDCSFLLIKGEQIQGGILFRKTGTDYVLSYLCVFGQASPVDMMALFYAAYEKLEKRDMEHTNIYIQAVTESTGKMVMKMTDQKAKQVGQAVSWVKTY